MLSTWSENQNVGCEYPVKSSTELLDKLENILLIQSDMSGPDGIGYFTYTVKNLEIEFEFFSEIWKKKVIHRHRQCQENC